MAITDIDNEYFDRVIGDLDTVLLDIPLKAFEKYFPKALEERLEKCSDDILRCLKSLPDGHLPFQHYTKENLEETVHTLIRGINKSVEWYYKGAIGQASKTFEATLKEIDYNMLIPLGTVPVNQDFYRTRLSVSMLGRNDLFHNPFQNRHLVNTTRYSIPGLPALYLGSSAYVCWEEYNRPPVKDLFFSRFTNIQPLKTVKIQRIGDFLMETKNDASGERMQKLMRYLALFPLSIACSIKTKESAGAFRPEYIIPQLLLQYVTADEDIAGVMFPSTKVDYNKISEVPAYNYVFPVKKLSESGFCSTLCELFSLTNPTSIELEALLHHSDIRPMLPEEFLSNSQITILENEPTSYVTTAFGTLERVLRTRALGMIPANNPKK